MDRDELFTARAGEGKCRTHLVVSDVCGIRGRHEPLLLLSTLGSWSHMEIIQQSTRTEAC